MASLKSIILILLYFIFNSLNSQVSRKRFEFNGVCITIDSIGSYELNNYMQSCIVERDCTWIDTIYRINYDTVLTPESYYLPYKRSKFFYLNNSKYSDTIIICSKINRYPPNLKFNFARQAFALLIVLEYQPTSIKYKKEAGFFLKDPTDSIFYNELSESDIGNGLYDFSNLIQKYHLFSKSQFINKQPKILYSYKFKDRKSSYNFILFSNYHSPLYEILMKYHAEISTNLYTEYTINEF